MAERDTYWMHVIDTNPVRMVALFHSIWARNRFAPRSRFGDGPESFATAVGTVLEVADDPSRYMWDKLVENGITEEICACIRTAHKIKIVSERNTRYMDLFDKMSPFIIFVEILVNAGHHIESPESRTNGHVLSVVKENWSKLVRKMWDDRQLMLVPSRHDERMVVMRLMAAFLKDADSFTPILSSQDDFTIPLITRCMLIEPHSGVFIIGVFAFTLILRPEDCGPLPKDLHARMLKGTPKGSFTRFFERYTRNLRSCTAFELYGGIHMLEFLCYRSSRECDPEAKFLDALFHSHSLLSWLIDIVKSPDTATPTLGDETSSVIQTSLAVITYCLRHIIVEGLGDTGTDFLRFMGRADLFGALENLLVTKGETVRDASGAVTALLLDIWRIVDLYPSTLCILRRNFPRPRLLRACLDIAFTSYPIRKGYIKIGLADEQSLQTLWIFLDHLEKMSLMSHRCMRRGCNARRTARCKLCYVVEYCGRQCQILDWPEHRVLCGFKNNMVPTEAALLPPERLPFRFGEVIPWSSELPPSSIGDSPEHDSPQVEAE